MLVTVCQSTLAYSHHHLATDIDYPPERMQVKYLTLSYLSFVNALCQMINGVSNMMQEIELKFYYNTLCHKMTFRNP